MKDETVKLSNEIREIMGDVRIYTQPDYYTKFANLINDLLPHMDLVGLIRIKEFLDSMLSNFK